MVILFLKTYEKTNIIYVLSMEHMNNTKNRWYSIVTWILVHLKCQKMNSYRLFPENLGFAWVKERWLEKFLGKDDHNALKWKFNHIYTKLWCGSAAVKVQMFNKYV